MPNLIQRGQAMLNRAMGVSAGVDVTYTRGGQSVPVVVWIGRTLFSRNQTEPGPVVLWGDRDYLITAEALAAAGISGPPQDGDRVTETVGGSPLTFELLPPETGEPSWRYSDQTRTQYRLHVKKVSG